MIQFGSMSITLLIGAMYGVMFAAMLWYGKHNRRANRFLALLLIVIAMRMFPYIIGYAGYYDAYPWLSFLPYDASLAFGPLLYFHVRSLSAATPGLPPRWWWHFVPVAVQLVYSCVIFPFPLAFKNNWDGEVHAPYVYPLELAATFISMALYWAASLRDYRGYQRWLSGNVSDREDHHVEWVRNFLIALAITLMFWVGLVAFDRLVAKLDYFQQFPFYVWLAVLTYYLGTEGYRHARHRYPRWDRVLQTPADMLPNRLGDAPIPIQQPSPIIRGDAKSAVDWIARSELWRQKIIAVQWWRDPELTLASLARKLGTNTSDLSRAINDGLGLNFNELINRLRVDAVKAALTRADSAQSLLDIAFAAGFSSKASFNRSFKLYAGETPTAFRERGEALDDSTGQSSLKS